MCERVRAAGLFRIDREVRSCDLNLLLHGLFGLQFDAKRERLACAQHEIIASRIKPWCFDLQRVCPGLNGSKVKPSGCISRGLLYGGAFSPLQGYGYTGNRFARDVAEGTIHGGLRQTCTCQNCGCNQERPETVSHCVTPAGRLS